MTKKKATAKKTKKMGRPRKTIDMDVVEAACQFNATCDQVVEVLAAKGCLVSKNSIVRAVKSMHNMTFEEFRDKKVDLTRLKLVQKAVNMALNHNNVTMLIFCLKNLCKWSDKPAEGFEDAPDIILNYRIEKP